MSHSSRTKKVRVVSANPLFCQWLQEWRDEAAKKGCHSKHTYAKALQSLNKFPLPLKTGKDCNILKNFGQKICDLLDKKLDEHRRLNPEFDENAAVSIPPINGKKPKRTAKTKTHQPAASVDNEQRQQVQPGPSEVRGRVQANGASTSRAKSKAKPAAMTSLKVQKRKSKLGRKETGCEKRKPDETETGQQVPTRTLPEDPLKTRKDAVLSSPEVSLPRFSFRDPEPLLPACPRELVHEVIDLSQHDDPEPEEASLLIPLNERLLAKASNGRNPLTAIVSNNHLCDDDDDEDCIIISDNLNCDNVRGTPAQPETTPEAKEILDDLYIDRVTGRDTVETFEDSFIHLLSKPAYTPDEITDSILDISGGLRKKRESFLNKLNTQPTQTRDVPLPLSFLSTPDKVHSDRIFPPHDSVLGSGILEEKIKSFVPNQQDVPRLLLEDSDDELLIPLSQRLRLDKPLPDNDSFAQLIENVETPPVNRLLEPPLTAVHVPAPAKPAPAKPARKRAKETTATGDGVAKKKPRTKKDKPPPAPVVPIQVFKLRYVPEGSQPPRRTASSNISFSPSKCPQKISLKPGTFDIVLCVDSCEATGGVSSKKKEAMIQALRSSGVKMEVRKLNVGDFAWIAKCGDDELVLDCVVERKRTDDLAASIKDGRYAEQKHRLVTSGIKQKIYLIEEYSRFVTGGITDQALLQAQMNTQVVNDFIVKLTKNTKESAHYLATLTRALELKYKNLHLRSCLKAEAQMFDNHLMTWQEYNEAGYKRKKVCTREMFIRALMVLRGMSLERALTIVTVYPTVTALLQAFDECDGPKQKDNLLADLRCPISGRRIGPALSKSLKQIFVDGHDDQRS